MTKHVLSKSEVLHLAQLAKLSLSEVEISKLAEQLGETIEFMKNLDELDTNNILPTNSVVDLKNVAREDEASGETGLTVEEALQNRKKTKDNEFVVDRIM